MARLVVRGWGARPNPAPPPTGDYDARDWGILEDVQARLRATNEWDDVHLVAQPEDVGFGADETIAAVVEPVEWSEPAEEFDDGGDTTRIFRFRVTLLRRDEDAEANAKALDRLGNVASNAVNGRSLAGITFPSMTRLRRGQWKPRTTPEQRLVLLGDCTYEVVNYDAHDTTDP